MNMMKIVTFAVAAAASLCGCSTPQPVREQATHTAALMAQFDSEMREFARVQNAVGKARLRTIAMQERAIEFAREQNRFADAVRAAAGDNSGSSVKPTLMAIAQSISDEAENSTKSAADTEKDLAAVMKPLPSTSAKLTTAQDLAAQMGDELSSSTRLAEARAFFGTVRKSVDDNRQKIKEASAKADAAAATANPPNEGN